MARPERRARDTGQTAYQQAGEEWSGQRVLLMMGGQKIDYGQARIRIVHPFWADITEQLTYQNAAEANPRRAGEVPSHYIRRLAALAAAKLQGEALKPMPRARQSRRERDDQLHKLRAQVSADDEAAYWWQREPGEDG